MTATQLAILLGLGAGAGLLVVLHELLTRATRRPHPAHTAARLTGRGGPVADVVDGGGVRGRVG
ncbi:hypothetical protein E1212_22385, partial [Jiangella ureilytica]